MVIVGAGPIGLSALEFAKLSGARPVVMDMVASRLEFVRERMGVSDTVLAKGDATDEESIRRLTDGRMADVVVDATGSTRACRPHSGCVLSAAVLSTSGSRNRTCRFRTRR